MAKKTVFLFLCILFAISLGAPVVLNKETRAAEAVSIAAKAEVATAPLSAGVLDDDDDDDDSMFDDKDFTDDTDDDDCDDDRTGCRKDFDFTDDDDDDFTDDDKDYFTDDDDDDDDSSDDEDNRRGGRPGDDVGAIDGVGIGSRAGSSGSCFPAQGLVELENGITKKMSELAIGDRVRVSSTEFADVFMFTHKLSNVRNEFINVETKDSIRFTVTPGHYIYINEKLVPAGTVMVGDRLELGNGKVTTVAQVTRSIEEGLYNPQTTHGDIIVNGVRASTYTTAVDRPAAHALLAPFRGLFNAFGATTTLFEQGAQCLAAVAPKGH